MFRGKLLYRTSAGRPFHTVGPAVECKTLLSTDTVKPVYFACPLFREFREPDKFAKI